MAKQNKVAVNLAQDFTDAEKAQARANIGASQISYNSTVTDMTVTKEIVRPYMNTKYTATVGSDSFLLLPSTFADGMVVKSNGSLQTQSIPTVKNTHYINYINDPGSLSVDAYSEMTDAISNSEPVVIISATGSSASYLQFTRQDSNGYYFTGYNSSNGFIIEMHVANTRAVTITTRDVDCNVYIATEMPDNNDRFEQWKNALTDNKIVILKTMVGSTVVYLPFCGYAYTPVDSDGKDIIEVDGPTRISRGVIASSTDTYTRQNGTVTHTSQYVSGLSPVTHYSASWGNSWHNMREISSSISSGASFMNNTLSTPIQLSAGKKYLISPIGIIGNVEQTKTVSEASNVAYSLRIWLYDSSKSIVNNSTAVIIGEAEIANHNVSAIGQYPPVNGVYHGAFAPTDGIITPTQDLTLDTLLVSNGGNIDFGFNSSNPAILAIDTRITGINVMEIQ